MGNARKTVLRLLTRLENSGSYSNILLDEGLERSDLSPQDKKFAAALFYGVLERQITLDNIIREYSRNPKNKLGTEVRVILRMGLYQLLYMDSVPDNAAVDESVKLAKKNRNPAASGFINAMLREFIRNDKKLPKGRNATEELSIEYSAPVWLTEKWTREYGKDICLEMLKTSVGQAPVTARVNTVFHSLESTLDMLAEEGITFERLSVLPDCIRICGAGAVEHTKAYKEGRIHVQDLSSQLCCAALDPKENDTVLDLCAAPGGKTFTIAERMNNKGRVLAFDLHKNRAGLIESGAKRLGLDCIRAGVNNAKVYDDKMPRADKVLCDAPCSGLGVIRRKPEIKYKEPSDFDRLPEIQYDILKTQLSKLGNTPFEAKEIEISFTGNWFLPASVLADFRRQAIDQLITARRINYRQELAVWKPTSHAFPQTTLTYLGNVMNTRAASFYQEHGVQQVAAAYEKEAVEDAVLMFCKHCLRYSMGWCPIHQRVRSPYKEPYYLVSNDGKRFRLEFDCKNCQMKVKAAQ